MPKVGSKHFSYTPEGYDEARKYAKKSGKKMKVQHGKPAQMPSKVANPGPQPFPPHAGKKKK